MNEISIDIKLQTAVDAAVSKANSMVVDTEETLTLATDIVKFIKEKAKQVEKERKDFVDPLNAHLKTINAKFKTLSEPLEAAEQILKGKMLTFQRKLEAENRAIEEAKRKEVEKYALEIAEKARLEGDEATANTMENQLEKIMEQPVNIEKVRGSVTGAVSSIQKRWTFEIIDIQALAQARPELIEAKSGDIRKQISAGIRDIPGIRIYQEESMRIA